MTRWTPVCRLADLLPERGVAALVGAEQVAVFRLHDDRLRAIGNRDPVSGAHVLSRGVVGTRGSRPVVASPMHKQAYDLDTGECLDAAASVPVFPVRVRGGVVEIGAP
ncbi:nitrite reductase small subunit NirD [Asanoa sp. WMMD1127]|uniref:nitrite reductase small subunit NirD n=1 Tax=Asanoa sp. WMMD1127 TaxID=3016107 RepID=UPI002415B442|nr:nitrite reductase small subunit NirD [Asanoa sp. WMMD1127]MDG4825350.1 nitrite reductase small subunit NirD [Asanoa sp. WMMD1127]